MKKTSVSHRIIEYAGLKKKPLQQNSLTLDFFSLDLTKPVQDQYSDPLIAEEKNRENSRPLHLAASHDSSGFRKWYNPVIGNEEVAEMAIRVKPPWWNAFALIPGIAIQFYKKTMIKLQKNF